MVTVYNGTLTSFKIWIGNNQSEYEKIIKLVSPHAVNSDVWQTIRLQDDHFSFNLNFDSSLSSFHFYHSTKEKEYFDKDIYGEKIVTKDQLENFIKYLDITYLTNDNPPEYLLW